MLLSDNLMTDIYGANLYNQYLAQEHAAATGTQAVAQGVGSLVKTEDKQLVSSAAQCRSILVGVKAAGKTNPVICLSCARASSGVYGCL